MVTSKKRIKATANNADNILSRLVKLWKAARGNPTRDNFDTLELELILTTAGGPLRNRDHNATIIQVAIDSAALRMQHFEGATLSWDAAKRYIDYLAAHGVVEKIAENKDNHRMLACICYLAADPVMDRFSSASSVKTRKVISRWLGTPVTSAIRKSPVLLCELLYGPSVWDLYRPDVELDSHLSVYLYKQGVPVKCVAQVSTTNSTDLELPRDFS